MKVRGARVGQENEEFDNHLRVQSLQFGADPGSSQNLNSCQDVEKQKKKPIRRKVKSKLSETFPAYLQEAFFGKELMDSAKEMASSSSDEEKPNVDSDKSIHLSQVRIIN